MQSSLVEEIFISGAFHGDAKQIPRSQTPSSADNQVLL